MKKCFSLTTVAVILSSSFYPQAYADHPSHVQTRERSTSIAPEFREAIKHLHDTLSRYLESCYKNAAGNLPSNREQLNTNYRSDACKAYHADFRGEMPRDPEKQRARESGLAAKSQRHSQYLNTHHPDWKTQDLDDQNIQRQVVAIQETTKTLLQMRCQFEFGTSERACALLSQSERGLP